MATTIENLFKHVNIDRVISTVLENDYRMAKYYGFLPGQANTDQFPGRTFGWDRFDVTRKVAQGRTPGSAAAQVDLNKVGSVVATADRSAEETHVDAERIFRNRGVGQPMGSVDARGERYVTLQMAHKVRRTNHRREFMVNRMFVEGGFKQIVQGNDLLIRPRSDTTAGAIEVDFQHPPANQITMGDWSAAATPIIDSLWALNRQAERSSRWPVTVAWINSNTAKNIQNNTQVKETAGSANVWFNELGFTPTFNEDGKMTTGQTVVLRGFPHMTWHIYDDFFQADDGTNIDAVPDTRAIFTPAPDAEWCEYREGTELVQKTVGGDFVEVSGFDMWMQYVGNPAGINMFSVDNGLPTPYVPQAWFIGDITQ